MKKYFITGLVILLPATLTIVIVSFIFNLLTVPFLGLVDAVFDHYHLFEKGFLFLSAHQVQTLIAQLLIFISLFFITVGLGFVTRWFFFHSLLSIAEYIVKKIPLVRSIYKTCQEVIKTLFTSNTNSFKQVVLVKFPHPESYALGFITREKIAGMENSPLSSAVAVFVPTTPNPTSGFLVFYKESEVTRLQMSVEEAFKCIISCGVITPEFQALAMEKTP